MLRRLLSKFVNVSRDGVSVGLINCNRSNTVTVNGKTITIEGNHHNISVMNGVIYVDGEPYKEDDSENSEIVKVYGSVKVVVNGNVGDLDATTVEVNGNVSGNVDGTTIRVTGDVGGSIDGTTVTVGGSVNGSIDAVTVRR